MAAPRPNTLLRRGFSRAVPRQLSFHGRFVRTRKCQRRRLTIPKGPEVTTFRVCPHHRSLTRNHSLKLWDLGALPITAWVSPDITRGRKSGARSGGEWSASFQGARSRKAYIEQRRC